MVVSQLPHGPKCLSAHCAHCAHCSLLTAAFLVGRVPEKGKCRPTPPQEKPPAQLPKDRASETLQTECSLLPKTTGKEEDGRLLSSSTSHHFTSLQSQSQTFLTNLPRDNIYLAPSISQSTITPVPSVSASVVSQGQIAVAHIPVTPIFHLFFVLSGHEPLLQGRCSPAPAASSTLEHEPTA